MMDDITVLPSEQIKALMSVLMARQVQVPRELVLTDDAGGYVRTSNFLAYLGLKEGDPLREFILEPYRAQGLQKATQSWEPFLRLQLVANTAEPDRFAKADPNGKPPDKGDAKRDENGPDTSTPDAAAPPKA